MDDKTLRASEYRFRKIIEANADGIVIVNGEGVIRYANPAAETLFARNRATLTGAMFGYPVVANETTEIDIVVAGDLKVAEMRVVDVEWQRESAYLASLRDTTARKKAEESLRAHEHFLAWLNEISTAALETPDYRTMLQILADRLGELYGADGCTITLWDEEKQTAVPGAVSRSLAEEYPLTEPDGRQQTITTAVLDSGQALVLDQVNKSPYAHMHTAVLFPSHSILALPLIAGTQKLGAAFVIFLHPHPFTPDEIRQAEQVVGHLSLALAKAQLYEEIHQHADELEVRVAERTQELLQAYHQLQELDRLKSKFIDDISHELRTPLANLVLYLDLINRSPAEKLPRYLKILDRQIARLRELVEGILRLSQLDESNMIWARLDLNEVIDKVVEKYQPVAHEQQLQLKFMPQTDALPVQGSFKQLQEMITNLLENALNYTLHGEIQLQTRIDLTQNTANLQIEDTGIGIYSEDLPHLFERFYRGQGASQSNVPGIGLGLTIAQSIASLHNGRIEITSQPGRGTQVRVVLPLAV
ncbi:MAG: GAF domain-containing protein [Anaerolineales bacterium]|nr:GAF domain-containing protein [Anaerolineales bacterium]